MLPAPIPEDDEQRLEALNKLGVLDTEPDPALDRITQVASEYFGTPIALISLIDADRQWFKSKVGLDAPETPRDISFCGHAILQDLPFVVADASLDPRFADNPLFTGQPHVRFYAGQPLKGPDDHKLGTLCIIDNIPRDLSESDLRMLAVLGAAAEHALMAKWEREQQAVAEQAGGALEEFVEFTSSGVITIDESGLIEEFNRGAEELFGYSRAEVMGANVRMLMTEPHQSEHDGYLSAYRDTGKAEILGVGRRVEALRKDGTVFPISLSVTELQSGSRRRFTGLVVDISEVAAAQDELERFFSESFDLLCIANTEGRFVRLNPAFEDLLGYSMDELRARPFLDFVFPDDLDATLREIGKLAEGVETIGFENRYVAKDGSVKNLLWTARADPNTGLIYSSARDMTELRRARSDLERFFSVSVDLFCVANFEGQFLQVNPAFERVLGYGVDELLAISMSSLVAPEDIEPVMSALRDMAQGQVLEDFECRFLAKDGSLCNLLWSGRVDPETNRIYASARDVTQIRLRDAELARLVDIIEASPDFIAVFDAEGKLRHINNAWRSLSLSDGAPIPGNLRSLYGTEQAATLLEVAVPAAIAVGSWSGEATIATSFGDIAVQQTVLAHGLNRGDADDDFSVVSHDVSAFKEVERVKNEFISTVSHELRTPLTSIRGSLGLLDGGAMGELPAKAKSMVRIASQNTDRLIRLINDVLDLEKIQAGKFELKRVPEQLAPVIIESISGVRGMAEAHSVEIATDFETEVASAEIDHDRMVQVFTNLLSNAIKFSSAGTTVSVRLAGLSSDGFIEVAVKDQGPGIPADKLDGIFDRFSQIDSTATRAKGGTGLGLAIVSDIVALHGGSIRVNSERGQGSSFIVRIPAEAGAASHPESMPVPALTDAGNPAGLRRGGARLLVVEDDEQLAQVMVAVLEGAGHAVEHASSLQAARLALTRRPPDAILLDLKLPDGHGLDLLPELRENPAFKDVGVLVISGSEDEPDRLPMPIVVDWLRKPVTNKQVLERVGRALADKTGPTVLVVEDDRPTRDVISVMLQQRGIRVRHAANGDEALRELSRSRPDLIVLDIGLPIMDGFEFMNSLDEGARDGTPVIVYTGQDLSSAQRSELRGRVTAFLTKTRTTDDEFVATVMQSLAMRRPSSSANKRLDTK